MRLTTFMITNRRQLAILPNILIVSDGNVRNAGPIILDVTNTVSIVDSEKEFSMPDLTRELHEQMNTLIDYINAKIKSHDWHAVADAAMDLREIEAKLDVLREINTNK